tara:strand:+ start:151 stop:438 length:288 start_codon:yes stop_codon:yes gene_type:complete
MGFRGRHKNKRDANEKEIVIELQAHGFTVERMDVPADLLAGYGGRDFLIEVKMPKATLTGPQTVFYETWRGSKTILRSVGDARDWAVKTKKEVDA